MTRHSTRTPAQRGDNGSSPRTLSARVAGRTQACATAPRGHALGDDTRGREANRRCPTPALGTIASVRTDVPALCASSSGQPATGSTLLMPSVKASLGSRVAAHLPFAIGATDDGRGQLSSPTSLQSAHNMALVEAAQMRAPLRKQALHNGRRAHVGATCQSRESPGAFTFLLARGISGDRRRTR